VQTETDQFLSMVAELAALGVTEVQLTPEGNPVDFVERLAERILPKVAEIG